MNGNELESRRSKEAGEKKSAELEAMIQGEKAQATQIAAEQYHAYLIRAKALVEEQSDQATKEALAENLANALLEQRYILSVSYPELPVAIRAQILKVATEASEHYQEDCQSPTSKEKRGVVLQGRRSAIVSANGPTRR